MRHRLSALIVLTSVCLLLVGCGTAVPDVKGMTVAQATTAIKVAGFEVGKAAYDGSAQGAAGAVIAQNPEAGKRVSTGSVINLTVAGPPPVVSPDLGGLDKDEAEAALSAAGLTLGEVTESYDESAGVGAVASQQPDAGTEVAKGSAVDIVVSKGPMPIGVPTVVGKTETEAKSLLEAAGFKAKTVTASNKAKKGTVITQKPAGGANAQPGTIVTITVSTGVEFVRVPRVIGMYPDAAAKILRAAGLGVHDVPIHGPIDADASKASIGQVYRQTPKSGTLVPKGTTIEIRSWWEAG